MALCKTGEKKSAQKAIAKTRTCGDGDSGTNKPAIEHLKSKRIDYAVCHPFLFGPAVEREKYGGEKTGKTRSLGTPPNLKPRKPKIASGLLKGWTEYYLKRGFQHVFAYMVTVKHAVDLVEKELQCERGKTYAANHVCSSEGGK